MEDQQLAVNELNLHEKDGEERPKEGLSTFIGQSVDAFQKQFGKPSRIEPSYYGYTWWVYNQNNKYMLAGILNQKVVTITVATPGMDTTPFEIGENLESVYQNVTMQPEIEFETENGAYRFELFEDDLNIKPLIPLGDIYAQLYFDQFEGKLLFIRFMDKETLIKHRPYDMAYRGQLIESEPLTEEEWRNADFASEQQIYELTNFVRKSIELHNLHWNEELREVAYKHSVDMFATETFSHESENFGDLSDRLSEIEYLL